MTVHHLPLDVGARARALLHHLLDHSDVVGVDQTGRTVLAIHVDDWVLDQLATFDAETEDLEGEGEVGAG